MKRSVCPVITQAISLRLFLFFLLFVVFSHFPLRASTEGLVWSYHPRSGYVDATPALGDIDGDGVQDLVMASTSGEIIALDAHGHRKWSYDAGEVISNPLALAGRPLRVYALTNPGRVLCLDAHSGNKLWEYHMPETFIWGMTAPAAADMNRDGRIDLVVADRGGNLVCLNDKGDVIWMKKFRNSFNTAPAITDLDGDGYPEILVGSKEMTLLCFSDKGKELWHAKSGEASGSSPIVYDLNGNGKPEILVGEGNGLSVYAAGGFLLWHYPMKMEVHDAIAAGDIDGDGKIEIVVVDMHGDVACLSNDGKLKWRGDVKKRVRRSPALADIDGDGKVEVVIGGYAEDLYVFDNAGNLKEQIPLNGGMNATPVIADFYGNGHPDIVCATTADVMVLTRMPEHGNRHPRVLWSQYRINEARTGAELPQHAKKRTGITATDYGPLHVGINTWRVTVTNPERKNLTLEMSFQKDDARPVVQKTTAADTFFVLRMNYNVNGDHPEDLHFSCRLTAGGKILDQRRQQYYLVPFAKDREDLRRTLAAVKDNLPRLKDREYIREKIKLMELQRQDLEKKTGLAGVMTPLERAGLRTQFEKLQKTTTELKAVTDAAAKAGSALAAYGANPWAPFGGVEDIVEGRTRAPQLTIEAFSGEIESAAVNLANFSGKTITVRVEPEDLQREGSRDKVSFRKVLEFHEVLDVPTHTLDMSADALPVMNQARTLVLAPWSVRQVWVNVNVAKLKPGTWAAGIRFRTVEVEPAETHATLKITVWPVGLSHKDPVRNCQWGYVESSVLKDIPEAALKDQVDHGTNVFVATGAFSPKARFNGQGELTGKLDFTAQDGYVRKHSPYGIILFSGYQSALQGPARFLSPIWMKAYREWIARWSKHLLEIGLGYDDFAFYPVDEPGLHKGQVDEVVALAKPIKEVNPNLKVYTDPVARTSMSDLKKMAPYIDIWCPNRNGYLRHEGADKLAFIKSTGKTVWTYECEGDAKHQSPLGYYRAQAWLSWWRGLTGIGFWSYCTSSFNPWYVPRGGQDYLLVYQGDGVVTSKRWEAVRDGTEDYDILRQLQQAADHPPAGISRELLQQIRQFLDKDAPVVAGFCGLEKEGTLPGADGLPGMRRTADRRWKTIQQARRTMARLLEELQK